MDKKQKSNYDKEYNQRINVRQVKIDRATNWNKENLERRRKIARESLARRRLLNPGVHNAYMRQRTKERKIKVINAYGGKCVCCGENRIEFLSVNHPHNDGAEHRKKIGRSCTYPWLIRNDFPPEYELMCMNCNSSIGFYGYCPHKKESNFEK